MATLHFIAYKANGQPAYCGAGKKGERMAEDVARAGLTHIVREIKKENCPVCYPPKIDPLADPDKEPEPVEIPKEAVEMGCCEICGNGKSFGHKFENHVLIRICRDCGARLDLDTMKLLNFKESLTK